MSIDDHKRLLEGTSIESVELLDLGDRVVIKSLKLANGFKAHLAPSTKGVFIFKWEDLNVEQSNSRSTTENRTQTGPASRKAFNKRKTGKWSVKTSRKSSTRMPRMRRSS